MTTNTVLVKRLSKVFLKNATRPAGVRAAAALNHNLISLGYTLNQKAFTKAANASIEDLNELYNSVKELVSVPNYNPMYPNFPDQVANAADAELMMNAVVHYVGVVFGLNILPEYVADIRPELDEKVGLTVLDISYKMGIYKLFEQIASQSRPFSESDKEDLKTLSEYAKFVKTSVRENAATLAGLFQDFDWSENFTDVTDVLRLAVVYSGGDPSLTTNTKFKLSRKQRREILSLLDKVLDKPYKVQDLTLHREEWKKLTYHLHYREYATEKVSDALESLQTGSLKSFNSIIEYAIKTNDYQTAITQLTRKPGVFARRLQELLVKLPNHESSIIDAFEEVSTKVSKAVLIQMWNLFNGSGRKDLKERLILSNRGKNPMFITNKLSSDYSRVVEIIEKALTDTREVDTVYVEDKELMSGIVLPLYLRNTQESIKSLALGSRVKMNGDKGTIRLFQHWRNINTKSYYGRVDLDLSAMFVDENFTTINEIAYYNLRDKSAGFYHSGDITDAPNGAAEFIDIDIQKALDKGYRYVLTNVYNYTRQKLSDVPEAWAGVMFREEPGSGEIFEPSTVIEKFTLTSDSPNSNMFMFDLKEREIIWLDLSVNPNKAYNYNMRNNLPTLLDLIKDVVYSKRMTVVEFLNISGISVVESEDDADLSIQPFNPASILELLKNSSELS